MGKADAVNMKCMESFPSGETAKRSGLNANDLMQLMRGVIELYKANADMM